MKQADVERAGELLTALRRFNDALVPPLSRAEWHLAHHNSQHAGHYVSVLMLSRADVVSLLMTGRDAIVAELREMGVEIEPLPEPRA